LKYNTFQLQNNFTKFTNRHTLTFGAYSEKYHSWNLFMNCCRQSAYGYNSLADFYADANGFLANPNRAVAPITLRAFQISYSNVPGVTQPPQLLDVWYSAGYVQDEWRPRSNLSVTGGLRFDVSAFKNTAYSNPDADRLTFRDENGQPIQYVTGAMPDTKVLWSPRIGVNWDALSDQTTQVRGGTGLFSGRPAYVWISNQIGNTGVLTGFDQFDQTATVPLFSRPFSPDPNRYKPTNVTGAPAASYELALTDENFKFPQVWRTNIAIDRRLPWGMTGTAEYIYSSDVNGVYYINANLPAAQAAFTGVDNRPRYTSNRIHSNVTNAIVLKNQDVGDTWNLAFSGTKTFPGGFFKTAYSYGEAKNTVDPGSIAFGSWNNNQHPGDPNNPGIGYASGSPGHRFFLTGSYSKEYFRFGATTFSAFLEARQPTTSFGGPTNTSYVLSGDLNGDGGTTNDLIYIPRDRSEMNFQTYTQNNRTYTAEEQAAAWEALIAQDDYLSQHRGEYAQRGAVFLPLVKRLDFNIAQDLFATMKGRRHAFQFRVDFINFGNLLNSDWGVAQRLVSNSPLLVPTAAQGGPVDTLGRAQYRLRLINNEYMTRTLEQTADANTDVWRIQFMIRYTFN
jgi:hypothetical protein